jgi:hypothetical protein
MAPPDSHPIVPRGFVPKAVRPGMTKFIPDAFSFDILIHIRYSIFSSLSISAYARNTLRPKHARIGEKPSPPAVYLDVMRRSPSFRAHTRP